MTNHDVLSLMLGPALLFVLLRWAPIPTWASLLAALITLFLVVGLWGIFLNLWAFALAGVWAASKAPIGLRVLRVLSMAVAVLLILAAIAFYTYLVVTKPGEFFKNLGNPLLLIYLMPGIAMLAVSHHFAEKIAATEEK